MPGLPTHLVQELNVGTVGAMGMNGLKGLKSLLKGTHIIICKMPRIFKIPFNCGCMSVYVIILPEYLNYY